VGFKQIAEHYGVSVYDWLCVDLLKGFFPPNDIKFVHEKVSLTVEQLRELYPRKRHDPLFIAHYLAPWHVHWLAFERWRMHRELPRSVDFQIAIDPTTAAIKVTLSAEPATSTASEKPTRVRVSSEKKPTGALAKIRLYFCLNRSPGLMNCRRPTQTTPTAAGSIGRKQSRWVGPRSSCSA
jgi:hypothetical protein